MSEMPLHGARRFHSHAYFDHRAPRRVAEARAFRELVRHTFAANPDIEVRAFHAAPAAIDILIHPLTRSQVLDHTARALWLGTPLALDREMLEAEDALHGSDAASKKPYPPS